MSLMVKLEQIISSVFNIAISTPLHHSNTVRSKTAFLSSLSIKLSSKVIAFLPGKIAKYVLRVINCLYITSASPSVAVSDFLWFMF